MELLDEEKPRRRKSSTIWYDGSSERQNMSEAARHSNRKSSLDILLGKGSNVKIHRLSENLGLNTNNITKLRERVSVPNLPSVIPPTKSIKDVSTSDGSKESLLSPDSVTYPGVSPKPKRKGGAWRNPLTRRAKEHGSGTSPGLVQRLVPGRRRKVGTVKAPDISKLEAIIPDFVFIDPDLERETLFEVHRIADYDKHLNDLLQETDPDHEDRADLIKAKRCVEKLVKDNEDVLQELDPEYQMERIQEMFPNDNLQLQDKTKGNGRRRASAMFLKKMGRSKSAGSLQLPPGLGKDIENEMTTTRTYVTEGPVQLTAGLQTQDRYLFLFSDLLLVAKQKSGTTFKLKAQVRVGEAWIADCLDEVSELTHQSPNSFVVGWPTTNYVATFASPDLKELWQTKFLQHIHQQKSRECPEQITLQITNKNNKDLTSTRKVLVSNFEDAQTTVKKCMTGFGLDEERACDYQLWVISGKENSPYPLSGHELPYSIKLSHIRDVTKLTSDEMVLPPEIDVENNTIKCQFVLKEKKKSPAKLSLEESPKRMKKRSPRLMHFFRKTSKQENVSPPSPTGQLFGRPLKEVCEGDEIPKNIKTLVMFLATQGPATHGIFRRSANAKVMRSLKQNLDDDSEVDTENWQPHVAAAILKDYLRNLPKQLLDNTLFEEWVKTTKVSDAKVRNNMVLQVINQLSPVGLNLLKHVMGLFHLISSHSNQNDMDAGNLAICTGPSLLWPDDARQHEVAACVVQAVVQHLITNCTVLFGEEIFQLFGAAVMHGRQDSSTGTDSDSMHSLLSIPETSGPGVSLGISRDDNNSPHDSGLTMSDTQLYHEESMEENSSGITLKLGRSVSHYEHNVTEQSQSTPLSRSYDSTISQLEPPVPPPRRHRQHGSKSRNMHSSTLPSLPSDPSFNEDNEEQDKRARMVKRMSADSLNSMSETSETSEYGSREDMDYMSFSPHSELGTLQKSPSGAHLYLNEDTSELAESGSKRSPRKTKAIVTIQEEPSHVFDTPGAKSLSEEIEEIKTGSPDQDASIENSSVEDDEEYLCKSDNSVLPLSLGTLQMKHGKDNLAERSVLRKGMTSKGADVFPGHIRRQLATQSFHEDDHRMSQMSGDGQTQLPSYEEHRRRHVEFSKTKHYVLKGMYKESPLQRSKYFSPEVSLSDTSLSIPLVQGEPDIGSLDDSSIDTSNSDIDIFRPTEPPSYTEALHRRALIKKQLEIPISDDDCIEQSFRSAQARKIFEKSQRLYKEQMASKSSSDQKSSLYSDTKRSTFTKKDIMIKERLIKTEKTSLVELKSANQLREQKISKIRKGSEKIVSTDSQRSQETQMSREVQRSTVEAFSPARRRRIAKAEDRSNVHRHSDTGLENVVRKNAENSERNQNDFEASRIYLNRSKSDSAEIVNKVSKYKQVEITWDSEKSDKLNNNSDIESINTRPVRSVRNRDWHKELAAQYDVSNDKPSVTTEVMVAQKVEPMYISHTTNIISNHEVKRRWSRPIHPTKDLAPHLKSFLADNNKVRPHSTHFDDSTHLNFTSRDSNKNMKPSLDERTRIVSERLSTVHRSESTTDQSKTLSSEIDTGIGWSVSGLRTKFDQSNTSNSQVTTQSRNGSTSSDRRRLLFEKTVPSEMSYV